jgi:hypothetical protein
VTLRVAFVTLGLTTLLLAGCNANNTTTPTSASSTATTTAITTPQTVTFPGVVGPGGAISRSFAAQIPGTAKAVVGGISPPTALSVALGIPRADGSGCLPTVSSTSGNLTSAEISAAVGLGTFCMQVTAPASAADAVRFDVSLTFP